ncbi:MAG: deoxyribodipyrimidine photo-lyase, partial [Candidatus Korobacteraceae bacterium]
MASTIYQKARAVSPSASPRLTLTAPSRKIENIFASHCCCSQEYGIRTPNRGAIVYLGAMTKLEQFTANPRVTVRRPGTLAHGGRCVVYWMQRAQRAFDNPALDVAVEAANALHQPVVIFFAPVPYYPYANLRHYAFLAQGIPDTAERARKRGIGYVLRRYPEHSLLKFCEEVKASLVVGDENPMREPDHWRQVAAKRLAVPL